MNTPSLGSLVSEMLAAQREAVRTQHEANYAQARQALDFADRIDAADVSDKRVEDLRAVIASLPPHYTNYAEALNFAVTRIETVRPTDRQAATIIQNIAKELREKATAILSAVDMTFVTKKEDPLVQQMTGLSMMPSRSKKSDRPE